MMGSNRMGRMPGQNHSFSTVPQAHIQRSSFDRSFTHKTTFDSSYLVPIFAEEVLPGDTHSVSLSSFVRLSTPLRPVMDNSYFDYHFWFVPNRLIWTNWVKLMGEQDNPGDTVSYLVPTMTSPAGGPAVGSLSDYFGIPTVGQVGGGNTLTFDSLFHRAYNFIYNKCYRDENLQNSVPMPMGDGPDTYTDFTLLKSGKRHDYFTSTLNAAQKAAPVSIPLGTSARIATNAADGQALGIYSTVHAAEKAMATTTADFLRAQNAVNVTDPNNIMYADLSTATAATINALRQAFAVQQLYERDMRGGTRYTELIRAHFNVVSPDFRLQRPEYLGGGTQQLSFYPIAQTGATGASGTTTPQGNLAGMAVHSSSGNGFTKSFTEHGVILGIVRVRADLTYQQGLHKKFSRQTKLDFAWPELAHIGEQTVLNQEIYADGSANDAGTFGYQERYAEYRYNPSMITGKYRSTASGTLDVWHLAQKFTTLPTLGDTFIKESVPFDRIVAVNTEPQFYADFFFRMKSARPLPVYGVPGLHRM